MFKRDIHSPETFLSEANHIIPLSSWVSHIHAIFDISDIIGGMTISEYEIPTGFASIADSDAQVLVLGSMPGIESLRQQQYYAHPRNLFWEFMGEMFNAGRELSYPDRLLRLKQKHIALWDVAHQCERSGSLDSNIKTSSIIPNDFIAFFAGHPGIRAVFFNGRKAADIYQRSVILNLPEPFRSIPYCTLPSTSPAHAAISREDKLEQWLQILNATATISS